MFTNEKLPATGGNDMCVIVGHELYILSAFLQIVIKTLVSETGKHSKSHTSSPEHTKIGLKFSFEYFESQVSRSVEGSVY